MYSPTFEEINFIHAPIPVENIQNTIKLMKEFKLSDPDDVRVMVNVKKVDALWFKNQHYLSHYCGNCNNERDYKKYINSKKDILNSAVKSPIDISVYKNDKGGDVIMFYNGRNRFSNLRDSGVKAIPAIIDKSDVMRFEKLGLIIKMAGSKRKTKKQKKYDIGF